MTACTTTVSLNSESVFRMSCMTVPAVISVVVAPVMVTVRQPAEYGPLVSAARNGDDSALVTGGSSSNSRISAPAMSLSEKESVNVVELGTPAVSPGLVA